MSGRKSSSSSSTTTTSGGGIKVEVPPLPTTSSTTTTSSSSSTTCPTCTNTTATTTTTPSRVDSYKNKFKGKIPGKFNEMYTMVLLHFLEISQNTHNRRGKHSKSDKMIYLRHNVLHLVVSCLKIWEVCLLPHHNILYDIFDRWPFQNNGMFVFFSILKYLEFSCNLMTLFHYFVTKYPALHAYSMIMLYRGKNIPNMLYEVVF